MRYIYRVMKDSHQAARVGLEHRVKDIKCLYRVIVHICIKFLHLGTQAAAICPVVIYISLF